MRHHLASSVWAAICCFFVLFAVTFLAFMSFVLYCAGAADEDWIAGGWGEQQSGRVAGAAVWNALSWQPIPFVIVACTPSFSPPFLNLVQRSHGHRQTPTPCLPCRHVWTCSTARLVARHRYVTHAHTLDASSQASGDSLRASIRDVLGLLRA